VTWGQWFGRHAPPQAVIASSEVGALAYLSHRRVLDLTGVLSPELETVTRGRPEAIERFEFARVARPAFLAHHAPKPFLLMERAPFPQALVPLGHGPAGGPDSVITFYRLDWPRFDAQAGREPPARSTPRRRLHARAPNLHDDGSPARFLLTRRCSDGGARRGGKCGVGGFSSIRGPSECAANAFHFSERKLTRSTKGSHRDPQHFRRAESRESAPRFVLTLGFRGCVSSTHLKAGSAWSSDCGASRSADERPCVSTIVSRS
jgi:hypothetical protein